MSSIKIYKKLPIPNNSAWDRKTYNPYTLFRWWLYDKIRYTWFYNLLDKLIFTPVANCDNGFRNLYKWFKPIWNDRNWDDYYIFEILKQKLILQREYLIKNNRHLRIDQDNRDMTICLNLIERCQEEYYNMEHSNYEKSEIEFIDTENPELKEMKTKYISDNLEDYFKKYPNSYRRILKETNTERWTVWNKHTQAMALGDYNQAKCQRLLFKILNERINNFWD